MGTSTNAVRLVLLVIETLKGRVECGRVRLGEGMEVYQRQL